MKKILAVLLAVSMLFAFAACGGDKSETDAQKEELKQEVQDELDTIVSDLQYIKDNGKLVIGYTEFAPMNYNDENGDFVGFETEFAKAVCAELGLEAEFQLIKWAAKETELASKNIDCIWNGMTITPERAEAMSISTPYMANKQVLVVRAENADKYTTAEALKGVKVVAEQGSAGEEVITTEAFFAEAEYTPVLDQATALKEVWAGTEEACVVDYVTSIGMIGEGTDYADLVVVEGVAFADEQYGIAFRQGSDITAEVNAAITKLVENGTLAEIAEKYKLQDQIIAK